MEILAKSCGNIKSYVIIGISLVQYLNPMLVCQSISIL